MKLEIFSIILIIFLYWYFNIRDQDYITIPMPVEKMENISIFDGSF